MKKTVIGYSQTGGGTIEDHAKAHLHTHLMITGGINSYALQRFCTIPTLCDKISDVLDTIVKSELQDYTQIATLVRRIVIKKRSAWELHSKVTDATVAKDPILSRPKSFHQISECGTQYLSTGKIQPFVPCMVGCNATLSGAPCTIHIVWVHFFRPSLHVQFIVVSHEMTHRQLAHQAVLIFTILIRYQAPTTK
jgi:hypothetical protein